MPVPTSILQGTLLAGKYQVGRELGRGGMAAVYEANNVTIGKRVAIKLLAGHLATSKTVVERFLREARAVAKIKSPHICDIYDSGRLDDGTPFLVMELLEGESLYDAMCRDRQMSPKLTLSIILQVCRGLSKAHAKQIVHRDLKPENIFLTVDDDGQLLVKVLDFGLAKFYDPVETSGAKGKHARLTREGAVFGTPAYMSPQQVRGQAAADTRADLWALACITYECFTGATVWSTEDGVAMTFAQIATAPLPDPRGYRPDLPDTFGAWFKKALDRDIEKRFQTVKAFADELALAFNYTSSGGGLDARLVNRITHEASTGADSEEVTRIQARKLPEPPTPLALPTPSGGSQPSGALPVELRRPQFETGAALSLSGRRGRMAVSVAIAALVGLVAAIVVSGDQTPPEVKEVRRFGAVAGQLAKTELPLASGHKFVANHAWLPALREAHALVTQRQHERALTILRRIYEKHRSGMVRNLMDQLQVAVLGREGGARCQVYAYARPRRYDLLSQDRRPVSASAPVIVRGLASALMSWTDARDGKMRAWVVPLDDALRNQALPVDITPEGARVSTPTLLPVAQRYLAGYWDSTGSLPGVYLRWLGVDGVIAAPPVAVTKQKPGAYYATAARSGDGFVVAWADRGDVDSVDVFYRRHDKNAQPIADAVRISDYVKQGASPSRVREIVVVESAGKLHFAYTWIGGSVQQIRYHTVPVDTAPPGLPPAEPGASKERVLGQVMEVTPRRERSMQASLACVDAGCFIAWTRLGGGASVAFIDTSGKQQWHKLFAPKGKHVAVGVSPKSALQLVWVESGRIMTAQLGRSGVGPSSKIARVVGDHPPPVIAAGAKRGEWYVAWSDYESGHREPYAARMECQ